MFKPDFNPDGSIKLPEKLREKKEIEEKAFQNEPSIKLTRNQVSSTTPLKCELIIEVSDKLTNPWKIKSIYASAKSRFKHMSQLSFRKIKRHTYVIKIASGSFRCSWCNNFRKYLEKEMGVKVINQGTCFEYIELGKR